MKPLFYCKVKRIFIAGVISFVSFYTGKVLHAQDLEAIGKENPLTLSGYVSTNQVYNYQPQLSNADSLSTFKPYSSFYSGSLNFNLYGVSVPLTFMYTNQETNFTHPFNQYGMHPTWKWLKGHIGYASMSFSPYTMNGYLFLGAGIEATPKGMFKASAMMGQLQKAVPYDTAAVQANPAYKRLGAALKTGIEKDGDYVNLILFMAQDVVSSLRFVDSFYIPPQENAVVSVQVAKKLFDKLAFTAEIANSAMTRDASAAMGTSRGRLTPSLWLMQPKTSTVLRTAIKSSLNYTLEKATIGLGYERVDPEYATLGAYYFTNNLENYTLNFTTGFFQKKVTLAGNIGLQKDNLDNSSLNNSNRFVGSINSSFTPNEKINISLSYSNFTSYTNVRSNFDYINQTNPYETWDTLNYRQISQNINFSGSYILKSGEERTQTISTNVNYQVSDDQSGTTSDKSNFYNVSAAHIYGIVPMNLNISTSLNLNVNDMADAGTSTWGPGVSVSKMFFDRKMRSNLSFNYNSANTNGKNTAEILNLRAGLGYALKQKHNFNLSGLYQFRNQKGENAGPNKNTAAITFTYSYNFNVIKKKDENSNSDTPNE